MIYGPALNVKVAWFYLFNPYAAGGKYWQYKIMQKTLKMTETLTHGYSSESSQWELSNEYQHDRV